MQPFHQQRPAPSQRQYSNYRKQWGRIIEVTADHQLVWEYISPYWGKQLTMNMVYRAYRVPYGWVPQIDQPKETAIAAIDVKTFRVPGAAPSGAEADTQFTIFL